ncbi:hypothetical protein [Candidatus Lokiarchaeum ossiferum]|uniref:hypothetical protein n=1 Tax=Candidatus Lokiarchaeum ossiferum TaxID=2951803 RepID=UPI00352C9F0A
MENHSKANHKIQEDPLAIPKRNFNIMLSILFFIFLLAVLYVAAVINKLLYGMFIVIPFIFLVRPERESGKSNSLENFKMIVFWIGLSILIWSIQFGIMILILEVFVNYPYTISDWGVLLYLIFPFVTIVIDLIIDKSMKYFHENKVGNQYLGWKSGGKSFTEAKNIVNMKTENIWKIAGSILALLLLSTGILTAETMIVFENGYKEYSTEIDGLTGTLMVSNRQVWANQSAIVFRIMVRTEGEMQGRIEDVQLNSAFNEFSQNYTDEFSALPSSVHFTVNLPNEDGVLKIMTQSISFEGEIVVLLSIGDDITRIVHQIKVNYRLQDPFELSLFIILIPLEIFFVVLVVKKIKTHLIFKQIKSKSTNYKPRLLSN